MFRLPKAVRANTIEQFLEAKDTAAYLTVSQSARLDSQAHWRTKLVAESINIALLDAVIKLDVIKNLKNVYRAFLTLPQHARQLKKPWEILCLSGEPNAIRYAVEQEGLTVQTKNLYRYNALRLAMPTVTLQSLEQILAMLDQDRTILPSELETTLLLYATECNNRDVARAYKIDASRKLDDRKRNALDYTLESGNLAALYFAKTELGLNPTGNAEYITHPLAEAYINGNGNDALQHAVRHHGLTEVKEAIHVLHINPLLTKNNAGQNPLHIAVEANKPNLITFFIDAGIDPLVKDNNDHDAYWYARNNHPNLVVHIARCAKLNPMHAAAKEGIPALIRLRGNEGHNPHETDRFGHDAYAYARLQPYRAHESVQALTLFEPRIVRVKPRYVTEEKKQDERISMRRPAAPRRLD